MGYLRQPLLASFPTLEENGLQLAEKPDPQSGPWSIPDLVLPSTQKAIVTSEVRKALNQVVSTVPVRQPLPHEVIVRICYSGICRSVSQPSYSKTVVSRQSDSNSHPPRTLASQPARCRATQRQTTSPATKESDK